MPDPWLIVTPEYPPAIGGVSSWAGDLAQALFEDGEGVTVLARGAAASPAPFPVHPIHGRSWRRWQGLWSALWTLPRVTPGTTVICATWPVAATMAPWLERRGTSLVVAAHGSELTRLSSCPPALRALATHATFLPVSHFLSAELDRLGLAHARRVVAPMPLPVARPARAPRTRRLVCLARATPLKGQDRARRLAQLLGRPVDIITDQPRAAALDALSRAAAAVLLPQPDADGSGAEGLGLVLLEAAVHGVPAIGCRTGGVPEAVGPGLLIDDLETIDIDVVNAFIDDPSSGEHARSWVCEHHGPGPALAALREAAGR